MKNHACLYLAYSIQNNAGELTSDTKKHLIWLFTDWLKQTLRNI